MSRGHGSERPGQVDVRRPVAVVATAMLVVALLGAAHHVRFRGWLGCALIDAGAHVLPDPAEHDVRFARSIADHCVRDAAERLMARRDYARRGLP